MIRTLRPPHASIDSLLTNLDCRGIPIPRIVTTGTTVDLEEPAMTLAATGMIIISLALPPAPDLVLKTATRVVGIP